MKILIATDKFKESMTAETACSILAEEALRGSPGSQIEQAPITDGGDGFVTIMTKAVDGALISLMVSDPSGRRVRAQYGLVALEKLSGSTKALLNIPEEGTLAIIEMAQASGICLLSPEERNPWIASSRGTGEILKAVSKKNVAAILLGIGGSATNDLGLGTLEILGLKAFSASGSQITNLIPANWPLIEYFEKPDTKHSSMPPIRIACDVENPLFGENGATAVYGAQKGLKAGDRDAMEQQAGRIAELLCKVTGSSRQTSEEAGAGAAGGIGWGLKQLFDVAYVPGFDLVYRWVDLDEKMNNADIVITGEGRFDNSSLQGKGPGSLALETISRGKRLYVFAGSIAPDLLKKMRTKTDGTIDLIEIKPEACSIAQAIAEGPKLLRTAARRVFSRMKSRQ